MENNTITMLQIMKKSPLFNVIHTDLCKIIQLTLNFPFCLQTKTGLALLYDENTSNTYDIRLKLTKEILIIQKQDVVCIGGGAHHLNVSTEALKCAERFNFTDA